MITNSDYTDVTLCLAMTARPVSELNIGSFVSYLGIAVNKSSRSPRELMS